MRAAKVTTVPIFTAESIVSRHFKRIVGLRRSKLAHQGKISGMYIQYPEYMRSSSGCCRRNRVIRFVIGQQDRVAFARKADIVEAQHTGSQLNDLVANICIIL